MANGGRPPLTEEQIKEQKEDILRKIEPYLKSGLSIGKALYEAQIAKTRFYEYYADDPSFAEKINGFRNFVAVLLNNALVRQLHTIIEKQNGDDKKKLKPKELKASEIEFLKWFALNSNLTKDEFGERKNVNLFDPEAEIQKVKKIIEQGAPSDLPAIEEED